MTGLGVYIAYLAVLLMFVALATTALFWTLYGWMTPERHAATRFVPAAEGHSTPSFSLLVPARHEEQVLGSTLLGLGELDYGDFEIIVVVGHDDPGTKAIAEQASSRDPRIRVVVDQGWPKNKPKALNAGLPSCRGEIVGVFDAEDLVPVGILTTVAAAFASADAPDVVQGGVQLMNVNSSWYATHNVLEYYFWFRSRLHFQARIGFVPLGGNTVFVRRDVLVAAGGWDEQCLAEDCELGSRLSSEGRRITVAYESALATREETPSTLGALIRQRTRWNQGYLQVLRRPHWRRLPAKRRALAAYTLGMPSLQAVSGLLLPFAPITALLYRAPLLLSLLTFIPFIPLGATLAVQAVGLRAFGREFGVRVGPRAYLRLIVGFLPYQWVLSYAALRAMWREIRGENGWEKTSHSGAHLAMQAQS